MPNQVMTKIPENVQKGINQLIGDDASMFYCNFVGMMPEYGAIWSEKYSQEGRIFDNDVYSNMDDQVNAPWVIPVDYKVIVFNDEVDQEAMFNDFKKAEQEAEKEFWKHVKPGDEQIVEYANAVCFNPAKRAFNGWPIHKLNQRLNLNANMKETFAYLNLAIGEKGRKQMAYCDAYFPLPRLIIDAEKVIQTHVDYFEAADKGTLTAEQERNFRQRLLEQEVAVYQSMQRVGGIFDPVEGNRIQQLTGIGNGADNFNRYASRGFRALTSDTEARIAGLKTGWPIEDLNALSSYKYTMDRIYTRIFYQHDATTPTRHANPQFRPGEQEYLTKMQQFWARIESTPVRDNETRMALLTEMRALIQEGVDKDYVMTSYLDEKKVPFCFALYDIDKKLERQLTPAELDVMEHYEPYNKEAYELAVQTETDQARIRREQYEQEQEKRRQLQENTQQLKDDREKKEKQEAQQQAQQEELRRKELEARAIGERGEATNPQYYDQVMEVERRRRNRELTAQERETKRLDPLESGNNFFFEVTKKEREEAAVGAPISPVTRQISVQDDLLRFYMGQEDLSFDDTLDLKLMSPDDRLTLAQEYYAELKAHPFVGVPEPEARKNARYFGERDAKAAENLLKEKLPEIDLRDPRQVENYASSKLGVLGIFTMDFTQDDVHLRDTEHMSSPVRSAYISSFGTGEEYAATIGRISVCNTLAELARIVNTPGASPLERAVALHFLQKNYDEIKGKSLSELSPDLWLKIRATSSALSSLRNDEKYPEYGTPSAEAIENFLAGGEDPFSEPYLRQFDPTITRLMDQQVTEPNRFALRNLASGSIDMARIYNLEYIRQNGSQRRPDFEQLTNMSPELKEKTHRIFDQTLGNLIQVSGMQSVLCAAGGKSVFDRFLVDGRPVSALMDDIYGNERLSLMTPEDREIATEAILMTAFADPDHKLEFVPVHYGPDRSIVEGEKVSVPRPEPQRVATNPVQPANDAVRFENAVSQVAAQAEKLDSIVPGAYQVYGQGHLNRKLAEPEAKSPEGAHAAKQEFLLKYSQASRELAGKVAARSPELAGYLRLQANIAARSLAKPLPGNSFPYTALMGLVDQIHLPLPEAVDEKRPAPLFRLIADQPDGFNAFPVLEAAQSAERLMEMGREHTAKLKAAGENAAPEEDLKVRREMLREITALEGHLDEMARVAGMRKRGAQLSEAFDDPRAVNLFISGTPGLAMMRAELQGRRQAIINGWPAEDIDLIAGFYAKRESVRQAIRSLPEGSENRLAYERAGIVLEEICKRIDEKVITNAEDRQGLLKDIDAYGPALYNDVVCRAGQPEAGQAQALKNAVSQARIAQISVAAFHTQEQYVNLGNEAREVKAAALREAENRENARRERVRQQRREIKEQREREKQEQSERLKEDAAIGEALERGLFDEEPRQEEPRQEEPRQEEPRQDDGRGSVGDWLDAEQLNEYNDELIDQVLGAGADEEQLKEADQNPLLGDKLEIERIEKNYDYDFDVMFFDQLSYTPEQIEISYFYPDDPYIRMLSEDENFFGNIFDEVEKPEAGYDLHGHKGRFGYFEWVDIRERLDTLSKGPARDLNLKTDRIGSLENVFRAYLMAKHHISFAEAYRFNEMDMVTRRKEASAFLDELEANPLNKDMSPSAREESAAYYGRMYREALENFRQGEFEEMDLSSMDSLNRLMYGPSMTYAHSQFALDYAQDTEPLSLSRDPVVRNAYLNAFGGREVHDRAIENLSFTQSIGGLVKTAVEPENPMKPLRNRAFAKYQLELLNARMKGKKYGDVPTGLGNYLSLLNSELSSLALPTEGAPSEQQLRDYLDGKIASPFTQDYIEASIRQLNEGIAQSTLETTNRSVVPNITKALPNGAMVYSLPYIPVGPNEPRPQPDYYTMSEGVLHDTHTVFTGVFGATLYSEGYMQLRLSAIRGESLADRFLIDGKRVSEMPQLADLKTARTPEEYQMILEAEILQAMADPKKTLTFAPLKYDANGNVAEMAPVTIAKTAPTAFRKKDFKPEPAAVSNERTLEIAKYMTAMTSFPAQLTTTSGLRPGDERLNPDKQQTSLFFNEAYYHPAGDAREGEMTGVGTILPFNHREGTIASYKLIHGVKEDGTLTEEGEKNYRDLKAYMNTEHDAVMSVAVEYEAKNPMLAEMIHIVADYVTTEERGIPWVDLKNNYSYQIIGGILGGMHLSPPSEERPFDQMEAMRVYTGYPYGEPKYTAPQAAVAVHRMAVTEAIHGHSVKAGTLSRAQDRLNRRMVLAELEESKKQLKLIDKLYESAHDENGNIDITKPEAMHLAHIDRHMEETVYSASSHYPRGIREAPVDVDIKHQLISRGWPLEDVNLLSRLMMRRAQLRYLLDNPRTLKIEGAEQYAVNERSYKVIDEICRSFEDRDITNAEDRQQVLSHIDSYGDLLYNDDVLEGADRAYDFRVRMRAARERQLTPQEFLSAEEIREFREKDAIYQAQKDSMDIVPTMNGPKSEEERAFLNAEHIARLMEVQGRMEADPSTYQKDAALQEVWRQINLFANRTNAFYRNHGLLDPKNAEARRSAFEDLLGTSTDLVDALDEAEDQITKGGEKTKFTPAEEKLLENLRQAKTNIGEMRRKYTAQMEYEAQRMDDMIAEEARRQAQMQTLADEQERPWEPDYGSEEERLEAERYMVDLEYVMASLTEADREELVDLLSPPIPGTERFDFAAGQELPPKRRPLPERIRMAYDGEGNLRPAVLLMTPKEKAQYRDRILWHGLEPVETRLAKDEQEAQAQALREERRQRRLKKEQQEKNGTSPYDEGAADFFAMADEDRRYQGGEAEREREAAVREQFIRDRERRAEADRRKQQAEATGDERYNWSFARILNDAYAKRQAADQAYKDAQKDPMANAGGNAEKDPVRDLVNAVNKVETTTRELSKYGKIYENMESAVLASMDTDTLDQVLERVRPEWYHKTYLPQLESMLSELSPADRYRVGARGIVGRSIIRTIPDKERHDIMGAIANELPVSLREQLRERLLTMDAPMERAYEDQVTKPLHDRVDELKRNVETVVDAGGNPLSPEVMKVYEEALAYADETLDEITQETYNSATGLSRDLEMARRAIRREQTKEDLADKDQEYLILEDRIMHTDERIVTEGVLPSHEPALDRMLHPENNYSQEYLQHLGHMIMRMEQMGMDPAQDGEQGEKLYAYQDVAQAKGAFADAVQSGDYEKIIETKRVYEEKRNNIKELMDYAKEHFSKYSAPGNVDTARNKGVPWEYSREALVNSQVNGVYQLYSILKRTGIPVQDFVADPYAARRRIGEKLDEERSYGTLMKGKPIGTFLGTLMAETKMEASNRTTLAGMDDMIIGRATDALVECNPDLSVHGQNRHTDWILNNHRSIVTKVRESNRNPFTLADTKRAGEVHQLLSLVLPEDLERNTERMLCGVCYDANGRKLPAITAQQYIASKEEFDYTKIRDRSADIIRDALSVENTTFDAAAFLEERQKALSMLLTARAADAGKPGFDALEYELTHMEEVYEYLRASNRKEMPALSPEQTERFRENARQYEATRARIRKGFTNAQKNEIAARRRRAGNVRNEARSHIIRHETARNTAEDQERAIRENRERAERARQQQAENNRLVEERRRQQQEQREEEIREEKPEARESERRIAWHASLMLTTRFLKRIEEYIAAEQNRQTAAQMTGASAAERQHEAKMRHLNVKDRTDRILIPLMASSLGEPESQEIFIPQERLKLLLTEELGGPRAAAIAAKLPRGIRNIDDLAELGPEERALVVGALVGTADVREQNRLLAQDDAYVPFEGKELQGSPYEEGEDRRRQFEKQLQPASPLNRQIRDLKAEIYNDWKKFTNGTGTKKQRAELAAALDYAEQMLRQVDEREKDLVNRGREIQEDYYSNKAKESIRDQKRLDKNLHLNDLREDPQSMGFFSIPRTDKTGEIRALKSEKMVFRPGYISQVTQMLRKMQQMELLSADRGGEEGNKVYAFHKLMQAQKNLKQAIEAKDRETIIDAARELKAVRRDMDELMRIAQDHFHPAEYMDNLDMVRNSGIPWDYARNAVTSSQVNSVFLFGNALMGCGISIDEFEADPGAAIQKMERLTQEKYNSVKGFAEGRSLGTLAADAATGYMEGGLAYPGEEANGRFMRSVGGLILADPGVSKQQRERNRFLLDQIHDQNSNNLMARQHLTLKPLKEAFGARNATQKERDALRTLMIAEEQDIDPDRMFTIPPIAADGTRMEEFSLTSYLAAKGSFSYQAQTSRLETILRDAAKEVADLKNRIAEDKRLHINNRALRGSRPDAFQPYAMLKARQDALIELLTLRRHEKGQPGYQALEQELRELPERYERLRKAEPGLNLPELTRNQKNELKAGAKTYDDLAKNRAKLMDAEEKRITRAEAANDNEFNRKLQEAVGQANQAAMEFNALNGRTVSQDRYNEARENHDRALSRINHVERERARQLIDDYKAGKLPEQYTVRKLKELKQMEGYRFDDAGAIPIFGEKYANAARENARLRDREKFLSLNLLESKGFKTDKEHATIPDSMRQLMEDLRVPWDAGEIERDKPVVQGREAQMDALLEDEPVLDRQDRPVRVQSEGIAPGLGENVKQLADLEAKLSMDEIDGMEEEPGPQQEIAAPVGNREPVAPAQPGVPRQEKHQAQQPVVQDKSLQDLEKKILGDRPEQEGRRRSNSVRIPQGQLHENAPQAVDLEKQQGPRMGGPV